jgi:hypothetical protein
MTQTLANLITYGEARATAGQGVDARNADRPRDPRADTGRGAVVLQKGREAQEGLVERVDGVADPEILRVALSTRAKRPVRAQVLVSDADQHPPPIVEVDHLALSSLRLAPRGWRTGRPKTHRQFSARVTLLDLGFAIEAPDRG